MKLNIEDDRDKVLGCWTGKNIGGTIGAPFEWFRQTNAITFYTQTNLNGTPLPNDDLDIQRLWLCAMEERGLDVTSQRLAEYWVTYVTPHWGEYGTGKIKMRQGLPPPLSGSFQNAGKSWRDLRDEVLRLHRGRLAPWVTVSAEDRAKGFDTGQLGYDVPSNIAFTLAGLLYGGDDFGKVQCTCVNFGEDTDCTAATAGALWGILRGAHGEGPGTGHLGRHERAAF
jgi:hypothetical protein